MNKYETFLKTKRVKTNNIAPSIFLIVTIIAVLSYLTSSYALESVSHTTTVTQESEAVFEGEEVGLEDEEASFEEEFSPEDATFEEDADFGEDAEADFQETPSQSISKVNGEPNLSVSYVENYKPAKYFQERQPREIDKIKYSWILPLLMIAAVGVFIIRGGEMKTEKKLKIGKSLQLFIITFSMVFIGASSSFAISYSSVKDAVVSSLGKGEKIYQKKILITPEIRSSIQNDLGWAPDKNAYKIYYSKDQSGTPKMHAIILSERLTFCGGLHKYCVTIDSLGKVGEVKILELSCDRSYSINKRSFLSQFKQFDTKNHTKMGEKYDAISGATLSTDLTRDIVRRALVLYNLGNTPK